MLNSTVEFRAVSSYTTFMSTAQSPNIITTDQIQQNHVQNITHSLNQAGHAVSPQDVAAVTPETPLTQTKDMQSVGAQILGNEDLQSALRDLNYNVKTDIGREHVVRTTESRNPLKILLEKLKRHNATNDKL